MAPLSEAEKSLAVAIASTRRRKRPVDLVTLAHRLKHLVDEYGSQSKVGDLIGISGRMVGQLMASLGCSENLQELISERKIDSADAVCKIAQWPEDDQILLAKESIKQEVTSKDVRAIVKYKIDNPSISVADAIRRVLDSKDKKTYTVLFFLSDERSKRLDEKSLQRSLRQKFKRVVGRDNLLSIELRRPAVLVRVTPAGMKTMKKESKRLAIALADLANVLLEGTFAKKGRKRQPVTRKK